MNTNQFDKIFKEDVYHHEVAAPDLMPRIHQRRTAWYVFMNKLMINRFKLAAAVVIGILAVLFTWNLTNNQISKNDGLNSNASNTKQNVVSPNQNNKSDDGQLELIENQSKSNSTNADLNVESTESKVNTNKHVAVKSVNNAGVKSPTIQKTAPKAVEDISNKNPNGPIVVDGGTSPIKPEKVEKVEVEKEKQQIEKPVETNKSQKTEKVIVKVDDEPLKSATIDVAKQFEKGQFEDLSKSTVPLTKWSMLVSCGPAYAYRNLDNSNSPELVMLRNNSEKAKLSYQGSILAHFEIKPGFEIYSGASMLQRREQMDYVKTTQYVDTKIQSHEVIEYHPVLPPKKITVYDTTYQRMVVKSNESRQNSYTHITIPLGFRLSAYGNNFGLHLSADGALQVASINKGSVLSEGMKELNLSGASYKRTQVGYSASAAVGVSYLISNRWSIESNYRATYFLSPTNGSRYGINQYDFGHGLLFGLKYRF